MERSARIRNVCSGRWGNDGRPESQARRSASPHSGFLGSGTRFGGLSLEQNMGKGTLRGDSAAGSCAGSGGGGNVARRVGARVSDKKCGCKVI